MPRRLRTFTLCTGTLLCVLIAAAFVVSGWLRVSIQFDAMCIVVQDGDVAIQRGVVFPKPVTLEPFPGLRHWNRWRFNWPWSATAPLYAVFLTVAVPTLAVWRPAAPTSRPSQHPAYTPCLMASYPGTAHDGSAPEPSPSLGVWTLVLQNPGRMQPRPAGTGTTWVTRPHSLLLPSSPPQKSL